MINNKVAFLFPGQGSQQLGMGLDLVNSYPIARELFTQADDILDRSLSTIAWYGPENELNDTINTQPALFIHSIAALKVLQQEFSDLHPIAVAGHSMGELSALTAAGSLYFESGLGLVQTRGKLMKRAGEISPGGMAAVLGLGIPIIEEICSLASNKEATVQVANDNCPGQVVISGTNTALDRAIDLLQKAGARRVIRLAVSIAAHSLLMHHAQDAFSQAVGAIQINDPDIHIIGNVSAQLLTTAQSVRKDLEDQLTHRVRWTETIHKLYSLGVSNFIEIGPGAVLSGLVRRIIPDASTSSIGSVRDLSNLDKIF